MATDTYINFRLPSGYTFFGGPAGFVPGDVLVSPSGTFNGRLQSDGNFVVDYGPIPSGVGLWAAGHSYPNTGPWQLWYYIAEPPVSQPPGNVIVFPTPNSGVSEPYDLIKQTNYAGPSFLQLNNNGTLSIYPGTNGVASGSALTTIGKSANFQDMTLTSINYDLAEATYPQVDQVYSVASTLTNTFSQTVTKTTTLSLTYTNTETYNWNTSQTVSVTIGSETSFNVPIIGSTKFSLQLGYSATFSNGGSNSSGVQALYQEQVAVPVPPDTSVGVQIVAYKQDATVPFTYTGVYHFSDGTSVPVSGTGEFEGVSTGVFDTRVYPISSPNTTLYTIAISPDLMTFQNAGQSVPT